MKEPLLLQLQQPMTLAVPGLHKRTGLWAEARGVWNPAVLVDRLVEPKPGFEALMFHEALHVQERHALAGVVLLVLGATGCGIGIALEQPLAALTSLLAGVVAWVFWRRECEVRADAYALRGVTTEAWVENGKPEVTETPATWEKGLREFLAFTLLHEHPKGAFWRWVYGRSVPHRIARAKARTRRIRWVVA